MVADIRVGEEVGRVKGKLPTKHTAFAYYGWQARNDAKQRVRDQKSEVRELLINHR